MATTSYLEAVAGGMVAAAAFSDDDAAVQAVTLLSESGVREQDICVLASKAQRAELVAGGRAWLPGKGWGGSDFAQEAMPAAYSRAISGSVIGALTRQDSRYRRGRRQPPTRSTRSSSRRVARP